MKGTSRRGAGAVEMLVALVLVGAVVHGAWRVFATQRRAVEEIRWRTEVLDADRVVRTVLGDELAAGVVGRDWTVPSFGLVELRAFRGWAVACPGPLPGGGVVVAYRGLRLPDVTKDSVLVLREGGRWSVAGLTSRVRHDDDCPGTGTLPAPGMVLERWTLEPAVDDAVLLRTFERGSYHLIDGSLRYRRGAGGRQPLTPAVFDPEVTGIRAEAPDSSAVLTIRGMDGRGGMWGRSLFGNGGGTP